MLPKQIIDEELNNTKAKLHDIFYNNNPNIKDIISEFTKMTGCDANRITFSIVKLTDGDYCLPMIDIDYK